MGQRPRDAITPAPGYHREVSALPEHPPGQALPVTVPGSRRPVILATFAVRIEPAAEWMAIESALEAGVPLVVANLMRLQSPTTMILLEENLEEVRRTAARAKGWGVSTELLMSMSGRRPTKALLRLAHERDAGLVVFGPDRRRTGCRRYRRAARTVRDGLDCLVWTAAD